MRRSAFGGRLRALGPPLKEAPVEESRASRKRRAEQAQLVQQAQQRQQVQQRQWRVMAAVADAVLTDEWVVRAEQAMRATDEHEAAAWAAREPGRQARREA